jgi:hypothetical protein
MIRIRRLLLPLVFLVVALMLANRAGKRTQLNREMNAVKAITTITTTIHTAETQYYSQHGRYAASLAELGKAGLIGRDLAKGEKGRVQVHAPADRYELHDPVGWSERGNPVR